MKLDRHVYGDASEKLMNTSARFGGAKSAQAVTLTDLLVLIACLGILAALLPAALARSKARSSRLGCTNCLKQIGLSFHTWSVDNSDCFPMQLSETNGGTMELVAGGTVYPHFQVMSNELSTPKILSCPNDEKRTYATDFTSLSDRNLSYFLNVDSIEGDGTSLLCGDRNITNRVPSSARLVYVTNPGAMAWNREIHSKKGNLLFGDGHVDQFSNQEVGTAFQIRGGATNRLAVP